MTIQVRCQGCDRVLGVGPEHAGKRARCPVCGHITDVPASFGDATSPYATDAAGFPSGGGQPDLGASGAASGGLQWRMRTPEGQIYGPVTRAELDRWVAEGRISHECQLQQGEGRWSEAAQLYPMLAPPGTSFTPTSAASSADFEPIYTPEPIDSFSPKSPSPRTYGSTSSPSNRGGGAYGNTARNPYASPAAAGYYATDHRGGLILAMGIISWLFPCGSLILGLPTWIMAQSDITQMNAGRMNPEGRGLTHAGMVIAIINIVFLLMGIALGVLGALVRA